MFVFLTMIAKNIFGICRIYCLIFLFFAGFFCSQTVMTSKAAVPRLSSGGAAATAMWPPGVPPPADAPLRLS